MGMGIDIGIGIPSGALNSNRISSIIPRLMSSLEARSTYFENVICTSAILKNLEAIK